MKAKRVDGRSKAAPIFDTRCLGVRVGGFGVMDPGYRTGQEETCGSYQDVQAAVFRDGLLASIRGRP